MTDVLNVAANVGKHEERESRTTLTEMLDLSLRTPEIGAVNFNLLHRLLTHVLEHIGLSEKVCVIDKDASPMSKAPSVAELEQKVLSLTDQINLFNQFPNSQDIFNQSRHEKSVNPAAAAWQNIQFQKKIETNEVGVSKSLGLIDEILNELKTLRKSQNELEKRMEADRKEFSSKLNSVKEAQDKLSTTLDSQQSELKTMRELASTLPSPDEFSQFVTWPVVSQALLSKSDTSHKVATEREKRKKVGGVEKKKKAAASTATSLSVKPTPKSRSSESESARSRATYACSKKVLQTSSTTERDSSPEERAIRQRIRSERGSASGSASSSRGEDSDGRVRRPVLGADKSISRILPASKLADSSSVAGAIVSTTELRQELIRNSNASAMSLIEARLKAPSGTFALEKLGKVFDRLEDIEARLANTESQKAESKDLAVVMQALEDQDSSKSSSQEDGAASLQKQIDQLNEQINQLLSSGVVGNGVDGDIRNLESGLSLPSGGGGGNLNGQQLKRLNDDLKRVDKTCKKLGQKLTHSFKEIEECSAVMKSDKTRVSDELKNLRADVDRVKELVRKFDHHDLAELFKYMGIGESKAPNNKGSDGGLSEGMLEKLQSCGLSSVDTCALFTSTRIPISTKLAIHRKIMESNALTSLQNGLTSVKMQVEKLSNNVNETIGDNLSNQKEMKKLFTYFETLDEQKLNKDSMEVYAATKADKRQLSDKVDRNTFEKINDEWNDKMSSFFEQMNSKGTEWQSMMEKLAGEIESKLDRVELDSIKQQLEKRLQLLRKLMDERPFGKKSEGGGVGVDATGDDAAGFRKQLVPNYNCISCNRPLEMQTSGPYPAIPAQGNMPFTRSTRPYTTFELDQIRQQAKGQTRQKEYTNYKLAVEEREFQRMRQIEELTMQIQMATQEYIEKGYDMKDLSSMGRACGGNYTMTYPQKRYTRLTHVSELWQEDDGSNAGGGCVSINHSEIDITGQDGQVYKGRLPEISGSANVPHFHHPPPPHTQPPAHHRPHSMRSTRAASARRSHPRTHPPGLAERVSFTDPSSILTPSASAAPSETGDEVKNSLE